MPHNRPGSSFDNFRFLFLFPLSLNKRGHSDSLQSVPHQNSEISSRKQRTSTLDKHSQSHSYATNKDSLFMKPERKRVRDVNPSRSVTHFYTSVLIVYVFAPFLQNETEEKLVLYFG